MDIEFYTFDDKPCEHTSTCLGAKLMRLAPITVRQEKLLARLEENIREVPRACAPGAHVRVALLMSDVFAEAGSVLRSVRAHRLLDEKEKTSLPTGNKNCKVFPTTRTTIQALSSECM